MNRRKEVMMNYRLAAGLLGVTLLGVTCQDNPAPVEPDPDASALRPSATAVEIAPKCGDAITEDSRLTADVIGCTGLGLIIEADGVTLDCDGHTISSTDVTGIGIALPGTQGATVKNCHVYGFESGIWLHFDDDRSADSNNIIENTIEHHGGQGLLLYDANKNLIKGNVVRSPVLPEPRDHNVIGIRVSRSTGNVLEQNTTDGNMYGVWLWESNNNRLLRNTSVGNENNGIVLEFSHSSQITENTVLNGILLDGSNSNVITGNNAQGTIGISLWAHASNDNRIENNDLSDNDRASLLITHNSQRNVIKNNLMNRNGWAGLELRDASHNLIEGNTIIGNPRGIASWDADPSWNAHHNVFAQNFIEGSRRPIDLRDCSNETIVGNEIFTNACVSPGIHLSGCSDSEIMDNFITKTGNHAHGIHLEHNSNDNTVARNTVHGSGKMGSYGILVYGSDRNILNDNSLTETGAGGGCDGPGAFGICNAYRADDNSGVFIVDADDNTVTENRVNVSPTHPGWEVNAVRLGLSANHCEGETNNVIADNQLTGVVGVNLRNTPTSTHIEGNIISGFEEGTGIYFRPSSGNRVQKNRITNFDRALLFLEGSTGNLVEHNNVHANRLAVYNGQTSEVDVRRNYWGTPCPPAAMFEKATGNIDWFPQLTGLYPPAILAEDENGDGIADVCSRCVETASETVPTEMLQADHYADIDGDGVFDTNIGSAASPEIVSSGLTLDDTHGCTCGQILQWKPGLNTGEMRFGCTASTMTTWTSLTDWAAKQ